MKGINHNSEGIMELTTHQPRQKTNNGNENLPKRLTNEQWKQLSETEKRDYTTKKRLELDFKLAECFLALNGYGMSKHDITGIVATHTASYRQQGLKVQQVLDAIDTWVATNSKIPTPADIIAIINPPTKPLDANYYRELVAKRQRGNDLDYTEQQFLDTYQRQLLVDAGKEMEAYAEMERLRAELVKAKETIVYLKTSDDEKNNLIRHLQQDIETRKSTEEKVADFLDEKMKNVASSYAKRLIATVRMMMGELSKENDFAELKRKVKTTEIFLLSEMDKV